MQLQNTDRKKMIQQGFDTVAAGYDHPSLSFFPETARRLIEHLKLQPDQHLLDVCTGTGCVALTAAEKLPQGSVTGIDFSSGMLQQAKNKAVENRLNNTEFIQIDLEHLSLENLNRTDKFAGQQICDAESYPKGQVAGKQPDQPFDIATSSFGLFFLEDMTKGLTNIANTVREGGKVAITSFTGEAFSPMADIFIKHYEATGRQVPPLSWKRLATEELIKEQFNAVDITNVTIHHEPLGYLMTDPQMWWDVVWNAGWRSLLNQMSGQEQEIFREKHLSKIAEVLDTDGVWFNTEVIIAVGKK